ncbi:MAG: hypothetical protein ACEQSR_15490 [Candidatus Methylacidiphilales bacterium]
MRKKRANNSNPNISYKQAKNTVRAVNIIVFAILAWLTFTSTATQLAFVIMALVPFACMYLLREYKGIIVYDHESGNKPNIGLACIIAVGGMFIRISSDYSIFSYTLVWIYSIGFTVLFIIVFEKITQMPKASLVSRMTINSLYGFFYSLSLVVFINCAFNHSPSNYFSARIIEKYETKGKNSSNNLVIERWHTQTENEKEKVKQKYYDSKNIGDYVDIDYYNGLLGIGWYELK